MFGWRRRKDGFEWREYVRTTILVRRKNRRDRVAHAGKAAVQGLKVAGGRGAAAGAKGARRSDAALRLRAITASSWARPVRRRSVVAPRPRANKASQWASPPALPERVRPTASCGRACRWCSPPSVCGRSHGGTRSRLCVRARALCVYRAFSRPRLLPGGARAVAGDCANPASRDTRPVAAVASSARSGALGPTALPATSSSHC